MAYYITLNADGTELKREDKGRGRPRSDYIARIDGNFYKVEDGSHPVANPVKAEVKSNLEPTDTLVDTISALPDVPMQFSRNYDKVYKYQGDAIPLNEMLQNIFYTPSRRTDEGNTIDIVGGPLTRKAMPGVQFNAVYARIVIDKTTGEMTVWSDWDATGKRYFYPIAIVSNAVKVG